MLNDHERLVLASIEDELYDDDPEFAHAFRAGRAPRARLAPHWPSLALAAFGAAMIFVGLLGRVDPLLMEGVVVILAGLGYGRWHARLAADRPTRRSRRPQRSRRARPC
jgi:hypothetical protein